jgi:hypothetical protein
MHDDLTPSPEVSRRNVIKKGAVAGGALMWAVPAVQTIGNHAAWGQAAGTPAPTGKTLIVSVNGGGTAECELIPAGGNNFLVGDCQEVAD